MCVYLLEILWWIYLFWNLYILCYVTYSIYVYVGDFDNLYLYIDFKSCNLFTYSSLYNVFAYLK